MHHIHQISCCQRNSRECITAAWLYADAHVLTQLVVDCRNLCLTGSNGHGRICVHLLDLSVDTLHHGLIGAVLLFENLDKLFGTDVIGKGPQTLAGTAGQQNDIHNLLLVK